MDLKELPASIVELPIFADLGKDEIAEVLKRCSKLFLSAGQPLMKAGELADCCYLILKGRVEVRIRQHKEIRTLATLESGQLIGEMGLFRDKPYRIADAVILRDSHLVQLPYVYLKRLEGVAPGTAAKLTRNLSEIASSRVQGLASNVAREPDNQAEDAAATRAALYRQLEAGSHPPRPGAPDVPAPVPLVPIQIKMALSRCPIFEGFDQDDLQKLIEKVTAGRYQEGQAVFLSGDRADSMYVVALGRLAVVIEVDRELQAIASLTVGQCFGELPLANGEATRAASVVADSQVTLLRIAYEDLRDITAWRPQTQERFEANLARLVLERTG